jgi:hypothetical protein
LTDIEIVGLLAEPKMLPHDYLARTQARPKRGHKERELEIAGEEGNQYRLVVRQSNVNPLDFSVILIYCPPGTSGTFRLRRHNGRSHEHTNSIEGNTFYDFHIHKATERYQDLGGREDSYAEPTDRFTDLGGAIDCLLADCGFDRTNLQTSIFDKEPDA